MSFIIWKAVRSDTRCLGAAPAARTALPRSETSGDTCAASLLPFFVFLFFFYFPFFFFFFPPLKYTKEEGSLLGGSASLPPSRPPPCCLQRRAPDAKPARHARSHDGGRAGRPSFLGLAPFWLGYFFIFLFYFSPCPSQGGSRGCKNGHRRTKLDPAFYLVHRREGRDLPKELGEEEKKTTRRSEQRTVRWDLMFSRSAPSQPSQELAALPPPLRGPLTLIATSGPSHPATRKPPESPFVRTASLLLRLFFPSLSPVDCNTPSLFCLVYNISLI